MALPDSDMCPCLRSCVPPCVSRGRLVLQNDGQRKRIRSGYMHSQLSECRAVDNGVTSEYQCDHGGNTLPCHETGIVSNWERVHAALRRKVPGYELQQRKMSLSFTDLVSMRACSFFTVSLS